MVLPVDQRSGSQVLTAMQGRAASRQSVRESQARLPGIKAQSEMAVQDAIEYASKWRKKERKTESEARTLGFEEFVSEGAKKNRSAKQNLETSTALLEAGAQEKNKDIYAQAQRAQLEETILSTEALKSKQGQTDWFYTFGQVGTPEEYTQAYTAAPPRMRKNMPTPDQIQTEEGQAAFDFMRRSVVGALTLGQKPAQKQASRTINLEIPQEDGSFRTVGTTFDAQTNQFRTLDGNVIVPPPGSRIGTTGRTAEDVAAGKPARFAEASAQSYLQTGLQVLDTAEQYLFETDAAGNTKVNLDNLFLSADALGFKGVPGTEGRTLNALLGSAVATSLFIRSGKQTRVDEKHDVINQLRPNPMDVFNPELVKMKMNIMRSLMQGTLDVMNPDGTTNPEATLQNALLTYDLVRTNNKVIEQTLGSGGYKTVTDPRLGDIEIQTGVR